MAASPSSPDQYEIITEPTCRAIYRACGANVCLLDETIQHKALAEITSQTTVTVQGLGELRACYNIETDMIHIGEKYLGDPEVLFHELVHWTGGRIKVGQVLRSLCSHDELTYTREELIANIGAILLCKELHMPIKDLDDQFRCNLADLQKLGFPEAELFEAIFMLRPYAKTAVDYIASRAGLRLGTIAAQMLPTPEATK